MSTPRTQLRARILKQLLVASSLTGCGPGFVAVDALPTPKPGCQLGEEGCARLRYVKAQEDQGCPEIGSSRLGAKQPQSGPYISDDPEQGECLYLEPDEMPLLLRELISVEVGRPFYVDADNRLAALTSRKDWI